MNNNEKEQAGLGRLLYKFLYNVKGLHEMGIITSDEVVEMITPITWNMNTMKTLNPDEFLGLESTGDNNES